MISHLRFAPNILARLGEELSPNPEQGLIELVKNAYDADADFCEVELEKVLETGGTIRLKDNGSGMTSEDIREGFLLLGHSRKKRDQVTKRNRLPVGDKGLGRLAALRLGQRVIVRSRSETEPGIQHHLVINWQEFDAAISIDEVDLQIISTSTNLENGTDIEILDLKNAFTENDVKRLARELVLLSDPFGDSSGFNIRLLTGEFKDFAKKVQEKYFEDADYLLEASVESDGSATCQLKNGLGVIVFPKEKLQSKKTKESIVYKTPPCTLQIWVFPRGGSFSGKSASVTELKSWLDAVGGVHVYHRGVRVRPYGDPGADWLEMSQMRTSHPEERPSANNVVGRVIVEDPDHTFEQPTSRIGFVENTAFEQLRAFARDALTWMGDNRLKKAEERRKTKSQTARQPSKKTEALNNLEAALEDLPEEQQKIAQEAAKEYGKVFQEEVLSLQEDLQLYRSLATAGTTSATLAHEAGKPIDSIKTVAETIKRRVQKFIADQYTEEFEPSIQRLHGIRDSLQTYAKFPLWHLKSSKRKARKVDINNTWKEVIELFEPVFLERKIKIFCEFGEQPFLIQGSIALVEAIAINLLTNSERALTRPNAPMVNRKIKISAKIVGLFIIITHTDNGPGIENLSLDEIWMPGKSAYGGTGFGLTIVRDSLIDLGGTVSAKIKGAFGGAEFQISLPLVRES